MKIYAATLSHKHGVNLYLASSREGRLAQIANYCREWWNELTEDAPSLPETDQEVVDVYFEPENMGAHEWVELFEPEEVE